MKEPDFNKLNINQQTHIVFEHGQQIMSRQYIYYQIKLFSLFDFFVEIWYVPNSNKIEKIEILKIDDILHLYNNEMDISELFKHT